MIAVNHSLRWVALAIAISLGFPCVLSAQVDSTLADSTVFRVEGIRVHATRAVTTAGGASAIEMLLDSMPLPPAPLAEELLRSIPTLHVRTNSRGEAEITVRGSESRQVAVLLEGVPLTLSWDARTDVSVLPGGAISKLNVVRGLSSMLYGPNVLGGVVEMSLTTEPSAYSRTSLSATTGVDDRGGYGASATAELPYASSSGRGTFRFGASLRDAPGFPLPRGVQEPIATENGLRLNTDTRNVNGFFALRHVANSGVWGSLSGLAFQAERGIAAELGAEDPRLWRYPDVKRSMVALSGGTGDRSTPFGLGDLEASVGLDLGHTEIRSYETRDYDAVTGTEDGNDRTVTLRLLGDHTLSSRGDLSASFTYSDIFHEAIVDGESADYEQRLLSLAGEMTWRLLEYRDGLLESLRLGIGAAWDRGNTPKTGGLESLGTLDDWGVRLGFTGLLHSGNTAIHAGISRRGRFPSLRETYSEALNRFVPNPDLHPEHLLAFETGVTSRVGSGEIQVVGFHHKLTDAIRRISLPDRMRMRINSDELRSTGVEVMFSQTLGPVALDGDFMLQKVDLIDVETSLSSEPENMPGGSGKARLSFPIVAGISGAAEAQYTGPQYAQHPDTGEDVELAGGVWWNGSLTRVWFLGYSAGPFQQAETSVSVQNLGDTALYDQFGLPRAGRMFRFQARVY